MTWIARLALCAAVAPAMAGSADASCFCRFKNGESICANAATAEACRRVDDRLKNATCRFVTGSCPYRTFRPRAG